MNIYNSKYSTLIKAFSFDYWSDLINNMLISAKCIKHQHHLNSHAAPPAATVTSGIHLMPSFPIKVISTLPPAHSTATPPARAAITVKARTEWSLAGQGDVCIIGKYVPYKKFHWQKEELGRPTDEISYLFHRCRVQSH